MNRPSGDDTYRKTPKKVMGICLPVCVVIPWVRGWGEDTLTDDGIPQWPHGTDGTTRQGVQRRGERRPKGGAALNGQAKRK